MLISVDIEHSCPYHKKDKSMDGGQHRVYQITTASQEIFLSRPWWDFLAWETILGSQCQKRKMVLDAPKVTFMEF
jgi:hypothetical protein